VTERGTEFHLIFLDPDASAIDSTRHVGVRIHSWALDLTGKPEQIEAGMEHLAEQVLIKSTC
jgi:hypothetical protein